MLAEKVRDGIYRRLADARWCWKNDRELKEGNFSGMVL